MADGGGGEKLAPRAKPVTLAELGERDRERLLVEARKGFIAEEKEALIAEAKKQAYDEMRLKIIEADLEQRKNRVLQFLREVIVRCEKFQTVAKQTLGEKHPLDEVALKWPGTALNRSNRMTMIGLISSIGYQMTCRPDGTGGCFLMGATDERGNVVEFKFRPATQERKREYVPDPTAGITRVAGVTK